MKKGTKVAVIGHGPGTIVDVFDGQNQYAVKLASGKIVFVPFAQVQSMKAKTISQRIQEEAEIKPKLRVDVNHNPTKKGIKVQFVLPQTLEGDAKAQATQKLQSKLNQGLEQYNLTVSQDTDVPYANVIGFLIPIADIKLLIKNAIGGGSSEPAPEEAPAPEEPMKEIKRMQKLAGVKEAFDPFLDTEEGGYMREYIDSIAEEEGLDLSYRSDFDEAFNKALEQLQSENIYPELDFDAIIAHKESFF